MVNLWQSGRDGMQGAFLQPIAGLWAKKATQQTARDRLITEHTELFRGSLDPATARRMTRLRGKPAMTVNGVTILTLKLNQE